MPGNTPQQSAAIVGSLTTITHRCLLLADARRDRMVAWPAFDAAMGGWRQAIDAVLRRLAAVSGEAALPARLASQREGLEADSEALFDHAPDAFDQEEYAKAYRLLGGYRGLYDALAAHAALAADFNWDAWRESRF